MLGTVAYMSPEQVRASEFDARTDLFSFGAVLYEMATGDVPFRGDSSAVICRSDPEPRARARRAPEPRRARQLEDIVNKALEKDRNLRYQHASEMRSDLQRLKRDTESGRSASQVESRVGDQTSSSQISRPSSAAQISHLGGTPATRSYGTIIAIVAAVCVVAAAVFFWQARRTFVRGSGAANPTTIAVLPFQNGGR